MQTHARAAVLGLILLAITASAPLAAAEGNAKTPADAASPLSTADGYRGIWYMNQPQKNEYAYKYNGGMGTYCEEHRPFAAYAKAADKTFFCYGGTTPDNKTLLHMVSYFDHKTGTVPRPRILIDKKTDDAHDNPVIALDDAGHIWIFSSSHGTSRPSYLWASVEPYSIDRFEQVRATAFATDKFPMNFSYPQPHYIPGKGFCFLLTRYAGGRMLFSSSSPDGREWTELRPHAEIEMGHYQVSERFGRKIGTCFNYHPKPQGLNWRTNLYYMETADAGRTWTTVDGKPLAVPLTAVKNAALVHDYQADRRIVYMKDINFDAEGRPILLYLTSGGWGGRPVQRSARLADRPMDRQRVGNPRLDPLGQQLRHGLALRRGRQRLADYRPDRNRPPAVQPRRRGGHVDQRRPGRDVEEGQTVDPGQRVQPHLLPPTAERPRRFLRLLGRRPRPQALDVAALLHRPPRHPRLASAPENDRRDSQAGGRVVAAGK
ncbi:MAG: BNR-4 repeat-containing protein [Planctomycetia bacterium]|nr:BNR-4 repeat-containing protein [Planctomycetia bacterium]